MRRVYRLAISRIKPEIKPEVYSRFEKQNKLRLYVYTNECNYDRSEIILRIAPPFGAVSASVSRFRSSIDNTILSLPVPLPPPAAPPAAAAAAAAAAASGLPGAPPGLVPSLGLAPWPMLFTGVDEPSDFSKVTEENLFVNSETFRINACWLSAFSFWISRINPCISTVTCPYTSCINYIGIAYLWGSKVLWNIFFLIFDRTFAGNVSFSHFRYLVCSLAVFFLAEVANDPGSTTNIPGVVSGSARIVGAALGVVTVARVAATWSAALECVVWGHECILAKGVAVLSKVSSLFKLVPLILSIN